MHLARPGFAPDPRQFGRGPTRVCAIALPVPAPALSDELKLFAATYAGAFLFVTVFLA